MVWCIRVKKTNHLYGQDNQGTNDGEKIGGCYRLKVRLKNH